LSTLHVLRGTYLYTVSPSKSAGKVSVFEIRCVFASGEKREFTLLEETLFRTAGQARELIKGIPQLRFVDKNLLSDSRCLHWIVFDDVLRHIIDRDQLEIDDNGFPGRRCFFSQPPANHLVALECIFVFRRHFN